MTTLAGILLHLAFFLLLGFEASRQSLNQAKGCGQPQPLARKTAALRRGKRIVGGNQAYPGKWPWIATLIFNNSQYCAGAIVNQKWVVTTSHCFHDNHSSLSTKDWLVKFGKFDVTRKESHERTRKVKRIIRHQNYVNMWDTFKVDKPDDYDVAVLELDRPINYTPYIQPVCFTQGNHPSFLPGENCIVAGWGHTKFNGQVQDKLNDVTVELVSRAKCNLPQSYNGTVHERAVCAGYEQGGRDACQYDSGGPLFCSNAGRWYLIGLVSWGDKCALPFKYGVYTNMKLLGPWVANIANKT